jgi:hypothetical protein
MIVAGAIERPVATTSRVLSHTRNFSTAEPLSAARDTYPSAFIHLRITIRISPRLCSDDCVAQPNAHAADRLPSSKGTALRHRVDVDAVDRSGATPQRARRSSSIGSDRHGARGGDVELPKVIAKAAAL